jgi:hypothetical protein
LIAGLRNRRSVEGSGEGEGGRRSYYIPDTALKKKETDDFAWMEVIRQFPGGERFTLHPGQLSNDFWYLANRV